jgi:glycogen operon protein
MTWLDWAGRDLELERLAMALGALREATPTLREIEFLGATAANGRPDVEWLDETGSPMRAELWEDHSRRRLTMVLADFAREGGRLAVMINGDAEGVPFSLPLRNEFHWTLLLPQAGEKNGSEWSVAGRTITLAVERTG